MGHPVSMTMRLILLTMRRGKRNAKYDQSNALQELSEEAVMSFDPVPPTDSIDLYKGNARRGGGGTDDSGTLSLFLRSLLPNFDANAPAAQA